MKRLVCVLALATVAALCAPPASAAATSLKDRLPEEAYGYVCVRDVSALIEKVRASTAYGAFAEHGFPGADEDVPAVAELAAAWEQYVEPLGDVLTGELVVVILPAPVGEIEPRVVLLADVDAPAFDTYMATVIDPLLDENDVEVEQVARSGLAITRIVVEPGSPDDVVCCVKDGLLVLGESVEIVERYATTTGTGTLVASEGYTDFRRAAGTPDVEMYVDAAAVLKGISSSVGNAGFISRLGLDSVRSYGWAMTLEPEGALGIVRIGTSAPPGGVLSVLATPGDRAKSAFYLPESVHFYCALKVSSLGDLWRGVLKTAQRIAGAESIEEAEESLGVAGVEQAFEMSLEEEILPAFGGELAVALRFSELTAMPNIVLLIEVEDEAKFSALLDRIAAMLGEGVPDGFERQVATHRGVEVQVFNLGPGSTPAVAVVDEFAVCATTADLVMEVIDAAVDGPRLGEAAGYTLHMSKAGGVGTVLVYGDMRAILAGAVQLFLMAYFHEESIPGAAPLEVLGDEPRLFGGALTGDRGGMTYRSFGRFEALDPGLVLVGGMVLPALSQGRLRAGTATSMDNAAQIGQAIAAYTTVSDDVLPEKLSELVEGDYLDDPKVFVHPRGTDPALIDLETPETVDEYSDYELVLKGISVSDVADVMDTTILLREKRQFIRGGRVVCYVDGHVEFVREEPEAAEDQGLEEDAGNGGDAEAAVQCPECGDTFVPDGSDPDRIVCPMCGALITGFQ